MRLRKPSLLQYRRIIYILIIVFSILLITSVVVKADDDDDDGTGFIDGDTAQDIGYIAIGLFAAGMINVVILYSFKLSRKLLGEEGVSGKVRNFTRETYLKTRKPLNWLHYILTFSATTIIFLHGLRFINKDDEVGVFGWIATGIFILYIVTGLILKLRVKPFWLSKTARKIVNILHRNLIIIIGVIVVHVVHLLMAD